jgi:hypothetical protein
VNGNVRDYKADVETIKAKGAMVVAAADLLALTMLTPPGEWGADVVVGNSQRFGVPLGFGGPHAGYMATRDEFKRSMPGRLVGVTIDAQATRPTAWRCKPASSTSAAKKPPRTSAPRRCCCRDGLDVRRLPRPARPAADRQARAPPDRRAGLEPEDPGLHHHQRHLVRHPDRGGEERRSCTHRRTRTASTCA